MPTYSYACTACDHRFDAQQSFADDALTECPQCTGRLRKLFSSVGVVFKGSGFYRTDSRTAASSSSSSGGDGAGSGGSTSGSSNAAAPSSTGSSASPSSGTSSTAKAPAAAS